ncbi:hypothetical protein DV738_g2780, partial [Chaetothyriales sp. CBS 135597]
MPGNGRDSAVTVVPEDLVAPSATAVGVGVACPQPNSAYGEVDGPLPTGAMNAELDTETAMEMAYEQERSLLEEEKDGKTGATEDMCLPITPVSLASPEPQQHDTHRHSPTPMSTPSPTPDLHLRPAFAIRSADDELARYSEARPWDFSKKPMKAQYPSSLFQTGSRYVGTQQSDRQVYHVEVTILTVDMEQCTISGYLQICGLTPDHPTLTTFFTGEIIGGPNQKHTFRTKDPEWGASTRTDITHWARFPAWRPLSGYARQDLDFQYPLDNSPWWQQDHIFMRWKEHFLVPDHKLRSIQGASFEGFYYICLNQAEGSTSGIYFHYKSEKFQQLELKHVGEPGRWHMGGCSSSRPVGNEASDGSPARAASQVRAPEVGANPTIAGPSLLDPASAGSPHAATASSTLDGQSRQSRPVVDLTEHYNRPLVLPAAWKSNRRTWTHAQLARERIEFFETRITGRREVWEALRQVAECVREGDLATAQGILDAAGITLPTGKLENGAYDEAGNLYRLTQPILRDPTNTVVGVASSAAKDDKEVEVVGAVAKDAVAVKCRLSDRGGPDVVVLLDRKDPVGLLARRAKQDGAVAAEATVRIAYLGHILDEKQSLSDQGWKEGHVVNALVIGAYR